MISCLALHPGTLNAMVGDTAGDIILAVVVIAVIVGIWRSRAAKRGSGSR
jgi:hypothetical protein